MPQEIKTIKLGGVNCNCYLIRSGNNYILVDTGWFPNKRTILEKELENSCCKPGNLKLIIITHGDIDHTGNCAYLREKYKTKIAMHSSDSYLVENGEIPNKEIRSLLFRIIVTFWQVLYGKKKIDEFERFRPDLIIDEGFDLSEYGIVAKILHIPGHTKGSIGILTTDGDLISGDTIFNVRFSPWAENLVMTH